MSRDKINVSYFANSSSSPQSDWVMSGSLETLSTADGVVRLRAIALRCVRVNKYGVSYPNRAIFSSPSSKNCSFCNSALFWFEGGIGSMPALGQKLLVGHNYGYYKSSSGCTHLQLNVEAVG